jgi:TonB family protein
MRLHFGSIDRLLWLFTATLTSGAIACGGKAPATPDSGPAPDAVATVDVAVDTTPPTPPPPPTKLPEAEALLTKPVDTSPEGLKAALALADALAGETDHAARRASVRLRLSVVAAVYAEEAARGGTAGDESKLGPGGAEKQVRLGLSIMHQADEETTRVKTVARALLAFTAGRTEEMPRASELRAVSDGETKSPERAALRLAFLARYAEARAALETEGVQGFASRVGAVICEGCGNPTAEVVARPAADATGLTCTPDDAKKIAFCDALGRAIALDPLAGTPANAVVVAAHALASAWSSDLAPLATAAPEGLASVLDAAVLPAVALVARDGIAGQSLLADTRAAAVAAVLGADGLRVGLRPIVGAVKPVVDGVDALFASDRLAGADGALRSAPLLPMAELLEKTADAKTGAVAGLTERVTAVRTAVAGATLPTGVDAAAVIVAFDPTVPTKAIEVALDGVLAAGVTATRLAATGTEGPESIPTYFRSLPEVLERSLVPSWARSMVLVVGKDQVDVWAPEGPKDGATPLGPEAQQNVPTSLQQGWRGDTLARLRVPLPPAQAGTERLGAAELAAVTEAIKAFAMGAKGGRVVHVVAAQDAATGDVLRVVRHLQGKSLTAPPELIRVGEVWPDARCRTENGQAAVGCVGALPVAWSKAAVPSEKGLKDKPGKAKTEKKTEPKGPAPSPEFCNNADIKAQILKKTGSIRFCYERELQLQKDLEGRVVVSFVIGLDGKVKSARVASASLPAPKVGECVVKEITKIQFKAPDGGECVVQYPFAFNPR